MCMNMRFMMCALYPWQVCIAFPILRDMVVIPKSTNPERIVENLKSAELKLDAEDMKRLKELDRNYRTIPGDYFMKTGESLDDFWDVHVDKKIVVNAP